LLSVTKDSLTLKKSTIANYVQVTTTTQLATPCEMLINEKELYSILSTPGIESITVKSEPLPPKQGELPRSTVTILAGRGKEKHQADNIKHYPVTPVATSGDYEIDGDTVDKITTAAKFVSTLDNGHVWMEHVMLSKNGIYATNSHHAYKCVGQHKEYCLPLDLVSAIKGRQKVTLSQADNYLYAAFDNVVYGFQKVDGAVVKEFDYILPQPPYDTFVIVQHSDILPFISKIDPKEYYSGVHISFANDKGKLLALNVDTQNEKEWPFDGETTGSIDDFGVNPAMLKNALECMPGATINIKKPQLILNSGDEIVVIIGLIQLT